MLNRRKNQIDYDGGDERQALLTGSIEATTTTSSQNGFTNQNTPIYINNIREDSSFRQPPQYAPVTKIVRTKTRDKSPDSLSSTHWMKLRHSHNQTSNIYHNYKDLSSHSYELSPLASYSTSRTVDLAHPSFTDFVYYTTQPGDTLHNLSVKYSCPVASIKRLNNLWSDQEFYGLKRIKLPAGRLRLITDVLDNQQEIEATTIPSNQPTTSHFNPYNAEEPLISLDNNQFSSPFNQFTGIESQTERQPCDNNHGVHHENALTNNLNSDFIFKNYDLSIQKAKTAAKSYDEHASDILQSLAQSGNIVDDNNDHLDDSNDPNKIARREAETLLNDMSDYGLSYSGLILFIFIVCLICPLAYVIYLEETHQELGTKQIKQQLDSA